jgi:hypothetical protein
VARPRCGVAGLPGAAAGRGSCVGVEAGAVFPGDFASGVGVGMDFDGGMGVDGGVGVPVGDDGAAGDDDDGTLGLVPIAGSAGGSLGFAVDFGVVGGGGWSDATSFAVGLGSAGGVGVSVGVGAGAPAVSLAVGAAGEAAGAAARSVVVAGTEARPLWTTGVGRRNRAPAGFSAVVGAGLASSAPVAAGVVEPDALALSVAAGGCSSTGRCGSSESAVPAESAGSALAPPDPAGPSR